MTTRVRPQPDSNATYRERVAAAGLVPLWTFFDEWFPGEPRPAAIPHVWRYDTLRPLLLEAGRTVSTDEAERRVLVLENPGLVGQHLATDALYAGLQLLMPGEFARNHRHTAAALRFIVEGERAYTAVEGERCYMQPGDFIVTPAWAWHEHRSESDRPTVWLDVLDVALTRFLGAGFSERYVHDVYERALPPNDSAYRYARNLLPVDFRRGAASPVFSYPFERAYEALDHVRRHGPLDPCHGVKMQYIDPTSGGPAIPTLSTFLQLLPAGFSTTRYRATASSVVAVVRGRGRVGIGEGTAAYELEFGPKDILAVPSWQYVRIAADEETVLFSASDEAVHRKLGFWREQREETTT
jgi:gentisate 1,2-dioxygenase